MKNKTKKNKKTKQNIVHLLSYTDLLHSTKKCLSATEVAFWLLLVSLVSAMHTRLFFWGGHLLLYSFFGPTRYHTKARAVIC